jgi:MATE family multidrug resistance protein
MTLVGTLFVGRLGASALAGVGLGGVACFMVLCFGFGVLRGVKVLVSQAVGAGRRERAERWLWTGLAMAGAMGIAMLLAGRAVAASMHFFAASQEAGDAAEGYVAVRLLASPLVMAFVALREYRYGIGDTRSPMIASVIANIANVALDYVLILRLGWGVPGAAWSTVCCHVLECGVLVVVQSREGWRPKRVTLSELRALASIGVPTGVQFWMEVGSFALLTAIVSSLGDRELAAHQIALQVQHFSFMPAMALGESASVLAGQAVGAGEVRLVRRVARVSALTAMAYTGLCTLVIMIAGMPIASAFTDDAALRATTVSLFWVGCVFQIPDGAAVVARGVLRGTGDVRFAAIVGIACAWVSTPPMAWLLGRVLGLGALGGWIGLSIEITVAAAILWWRLERAGWLASARRSIRLERGALALAS